jgi:hypothetical protein
MKFNEEIPKGLNINLLRAIGLFVYVPLELYHGCQRQDQGMPDDGPKEQ